MTATSPPPLDVAVIGYGWWGKTIAKTLRESALVRVRMVIELSASLRQEALQAGYLVGDALQSALTHPDIGAIILCTPHGAHAAQIIECANAGKHVFCEKPLCPTLDEARQAVRACREHNLFLGIGHERRFEPAIMAAQAQIKRGEIGEVLQIEANFSQNKFFALDPGNWRLSNLHAPVGPLSATGIHLIDLCISILGPATEVYARLGTLGTHFENGDTLGVMLGFSSGAQALISAVLATPFDGRFAVYGSKGWIEIRDKTHPESPTGWDVTTKLANADPVHEFFPPAPSVRSNLEAFAKGALGLAPYPVTFEEILANVAAFESVVLAAQSRKAQTVPTP